MNGILLFIAYAEYIDRSLLDVFVLKVEWGEKTLGRLVFHKAINPFECMILWVYLGMLYFRWTLVD